jgi:hypothetical protein
MDADKANKTDKSLMLYKSESGTTIVIEVLTISNVHSLQLGAYMPGYFFTAPSMCDYMLDKVTTVPFPVSFLIILSGHERNNGGIKREDIKRVVSGDEQTPYLEILGRSGIWQSFALTK